MRRKIDTKNEKKNNNKYNRREKLDIRKNT